MGLGQIFPIFPSLPIPPLASCRPTPLFSPLPSPPVSTLDSPVLTVHPPSTPPPHHALGYIAGHLSLPLWFQPRPARGPGPSRHACLGTRDGSSPSSRKQLPRNRLTSVSCRSLFWDLGQSSNSKSLYAMVSTLVDDDDDDDGVAKPFHRRSKMLQTHTHLHTHCTPPSPS